MVAKKTADKTRPLVPLRTSSRPWSQKTSNRPCWWRDCRWTETRTNRSKVTRCSPQTLRIKCKGSSPYPSNNSWHSRRCSSRWGWISTSTWGTRTGWWWTTQHQPVTSTDPAQPWPSSRTSSIKTWWKAPTMEGTSVFDWWKSDATGQNLALFKA